MRSGSTSCQQKRDLTINENEISASNDRHCQGKLAVIGIGPGNIQDMSPRAKESIETADIIVGYTTYLKLIENLIVNKEIIGTGMMQEIDRCSAAVEHAMTGKKVAIVSSGDPGIYGMAGLVYELVLKHPEHLRPEIIVIPGISAVGAAAAVLGAPLMHDFAVISLSDLLTPWDLIKKRVEMAASGDFVIALYNPKSHRRVSQIEQVREIVLKYRNPNTPVGIVHHATRAEESVTVSNLECFTQEYIDMFSLVIIGNSQTYAKDGYIITPRGYRL